MAKDKDIPINLLTSPDREVKEQESDIPLEEVFNDLMSTLPNLGRDQISNMVEGLLVKQMLGKGTPLTPRQDLALSLLTRKIIPNAETLKQEKEPVDHWKILSDVIQGNTSSFIKLEKKAIEFREHEQAHRLTLLEAIKDVESQKLENISHVPDLDGEGILNEHAGPIGNTTDFQQNATQGVDSQAARNNRLNEMVDIRQDGVLPPRPSDFLPHSSR